MANNFLITGYWGEPHVTAENDRGINAAMFGAGRFVLPVGNRFQAEYIGNNTIRMYDGKLMDNGAAAGIPAGEYVDLLIPEAGQGKNRNDLIVFQYEQDSSTLIECGTFVVVKGEETTGTAADPTLTQEDILLGNAKKDQMALWRVSVSGATIAAPVQVFSVFVPKVEAGGTGATTAAKARENIGAAPADTGLWYKRQLTADDDMNALLENGIYTYSTGSLPANCPYENAGVVMVFGSTSATAQRIQFVFRYGDAGQGKFRAYFDGWQEWSDFGGLMESVSYPECYYRKIGSATEWEDPPMIVGQEHRTTERWKGKIVYIKAVDCGTMPSAGSHKNIEIVTGLTANHYILDMKCIFTSNIGGEYNLIRRTVNYCTNVEDTTGEITGIAWVYSTTGSSSSVSVTIKAIKNISNNTAIAIVKYTK